MLKFIFTSLLVLLIPLEAYPQSSRRLSGSIADSAGRSLVNVAVMLCRNSDTARALSDGDGKFSFNQAGPGDYRLLAAYQGDILFDTSVTMLPDTRSAIILPQIIVRLLPEALEGVIVRPPPVIVKEDTLQFNAGAFVVREDATVEELIKKFPGMTVDRDGNITAQGKSVVKVLLNGKEFFVGDLKTATQNLPAEIVRNIQIIDDYGEQAALTGMKTGESQKIININTKKAKNRGEFGNTLLGGGTEGRYLGNISLNRFRDDQQLSLLGTINNTSMTPGSQPGARSANPGQSAGAPGLTTTYSASLNYRDKWGKKLTMTGSYGVTAVVSDVASLSYQQDLNPNDVRTTNRSSSAQSNMTSHRTSWTAEYAASPKSSLRLTATGAYTDSRNYNDARALIQRRRFLSESRNTGTISSSNADVSANLLYNHRFNKKGRNLVTTATWNYSDPKEENRLNNILTDVDSAGIDSSFTHPLVDLNILRQRQFTGSSRKKTGISISYTEPLSATTMAELAYTFGYEELVRRRDVFDLDSAGRYEVLNPGLTNDFQSTFLVSRYSLNIQSRYERYNYLVGVVLQPSRLDGSSRMRQLETHTSNMNWAPTARLVYRLGTMKTVILNYNGNYVEPDYQKLQPLVDSTNPSNILVGNPNLKPEFSNRITASYNASDRTSGSAVFLNFSYDKTLNKIVNNVFNDPRSTSRTTSYVNDNGFYQLSGNLSVSRPVSDRRYVLAAGLAGNFANTVAYTDNRKSDGQTWRLQPNLKIQADIPKLLDADLQASYAFSRTEANYGAQPVRTDTRAFILSLNGRVFFSEALSLGYAYDKQVNTGYGGSTNISPDIIGMFVEYKFAKRRAASVRLECFDLLNQNERLSRSVSGTTITDNRYDGLRRYLMLTVGWRLNRFRM